ncbi:IS256 family transposase [Vulcanimicrobium alpinum]|uniref:IS256 family transposase n=1 Tax=Vulcanimicrobium alpinum TaxID=3016050 RepID=UPI003BEEDA03
MLVVIGADADGTKHLVALDDAMSESELSWTELFEDLKKRGLHMPQLLIADGANGLWAAAGKALPNTRQQRCWLHKVRNVLDKLPEKQKPRVHTELRCIVNAPSETEARDRIEALAKTLQRDYPKAAACIRDDVDRMVTFYRFPSSSWKSLRTTNPIESIFASVRLRTEAAKRLRTGSSATYLVFKLVQRLSGSWRRINGYQSITLENAEAA